MCMGCMCMGASVWGACVSGYVWMNMSVGLSGECAFVDVGVWM